MAETPTAGRATSVEELGEHITLVMLLAPVLDPDLRQEPDEVWHYTDAAGAAGIITGHELWATDALFMNDASELQLVHRDFSRAIKSDVTEPFLKSSERERMGAAFEKAIGSFREDPGLFVVCFCENADLLSQWNAYGREGGGYALGFDGEALGSYDQAVIGTLDFFRVIYDRNEQIDAVATFCTRAFHQLELFLDGCDPGERDAAVEMAGDKLALMAQWFSASIKDAAFREEKEWRFICRNPSATEQPAAYDREFRPTPRGIIPFVRLPLGKIGADASPDGEFPLKRVRVGPTANVELSSRAINYMLKDSGFDIQAETSAIPLRA
ncbi:MAG: DUF2971 domain-containing protein [Thermoleophilaceae bacterium]